jgi:hypothetical protein
VILGEFLAGVVLCLAVGIVSMGTSDGAVGWLFGAWLVGVGLNHVPLALHALSLSHQGALEAELTGADVRRELDFYSVAQLWLFVPLALAALALVQLPRVRPRL